MVTKTTNTIKRLKLFYIIRYT